MSDGLWDVPETEEGLQLLLSRLAERREAGDDRQVAWGLVTLSWLVKWVRSDNRQSPFDRSHTLALEALEIFRRIDDKPGQITALRYASPFAANGPDMLEEAMRLATELGDELQIARVLSAKARNAGLRDRKLFEEMHKQALAIFERLGDAGGQAQCLFALCVTADSADKVDFGLRAAKLYREAGDLKHTSRSVIMAAWGAEEAGNLASLEPDLKQALADAQAIADRAVEGQIYQYLPKLEATKGDAESAARYAPWADDIRDSDGLTPKQRAKQSKAFDKVLEGLARRMGDKEMANAFKQERRRLAEANGDDSPYT